MANEQGTQQEETVQNANAGTLTNTEDQLSLNSNVIIVL